MSENFANAPKSIGELRSDKSDKASDWTPRDALISLLRQIDQGDKNLTVVVICMAIKTAEGKTATDFLSAGGDGVLLNTGLVSRVLHRMHVSSTPD